MTYPKDIKRNYLRWHFIDLGQHYQYLLYQLDIDMGNHDYIDMVRYWTREMQEAVLWDESGRGTGSGNSK